MLGEMQNCWDMSLESLQGRTEKTKKSNKNKKRKKHEKTKVSDRMEAPPTSLCQTSFFLQKRSYSFALFSECYVLSKTCIVYIENQKKPRKQTKTETHRENLKKLQRSWGCEEPSQESQYIVVFFSFLEFFCFLHGALPKEFQNIVSFCFAFQSIVFEF